MEVLAPWLLAALLTFIAVVAGDAPENRGQQRGRLGCLAWLVAIPVALGSALFIGSLSESTCGSVLRLFGLTGGGWISFHCLSLMVVVSQVEAVVLIILVVATWRSLARRARGGSPD
jgi:hypothetical protein